MKNKKTILITGGLGYIGSHGVVAFAEKGYETVIIDNFSNTDISVLDNIKRILGYTPDFFECDLRDRGKLEEIFEKYNFDGVLHFAGLKSPGESLRKPLDYFDNNLIGSIRLFQCMEKYGVKKIIFSSSANIYTKQGMGTHGLSEDNQIGKTTNPYGSSKFILENILSDLSRYGGFQVVSLRYFNPIGAHNSGVLGENPKGIPNNLLPYIMKVATGELKELQIFGNNYNTIDGTGIRDYIDINDLIQGHVLGYEYIKRLHESTGFFEPFNLGTGKGHSVMEVLKICEIVIGKELPFKITHNREGDLAEVYCNPSKAQNILHWNAENSMKKSIENMWNFYNK